MSNITFEVYKKKIRTLYKQVKKDDTSDLHRFFEEITPGKIKNATKRVFRLRNERNDIRIMSDFFSVSEDKDFNKYLENVNADKFIPVLQFLEETTKKPREEVIEFSAFLLDFNPRPYSKFRENQGKVIDITKKPNLEIDTIQETKEADQNTEESEGGATIDGDGRWKKIVITISFISLIAIVTYLGIDRQLKKCMTWTGVEYEKVYCSKSYDPKIIPIDSKRLKEFKKIKVDTNYTFFDDNAKAIVWYDKTGGNVEYFNSEGIHPTNNKTLKPVTQEIVRKYVFGEE